MLDKFVYKVGEFSAVVHGISLYELFKLICFYLVIQVLYLHWNICHSTLVNSTSCLIMCHSDLSLFRVRTGHWLHLCQQALFTATHKGRRQHYKEALCPSVQSSWEIQIHFYVSGQLFVSVDSGRIMIKPSRVVYEILHMKSCILSCQIQYQR